MRDRDREDALLTLTRPIYHQGDFIRIKISRASDDLSIQISPLTKFKTQRSFFLYDNGSRKETIALRGRQSSTFSGIESGTFEIFSGDESVFALNISLEEFEDNPH